VVNRRVAAQNTLFTLCSCYAATKETASSASCNINDSLWKAVLSLKLLLQKSYRSYMMGWRQNDFATNLGQETCKSKLLR